MVRREAVCILEYAREVIGVAEPDFACRVVYIGYAKAPVAYETKYLITKELDIRGSRNAMASDFEGLIAHLESGEFPVEKVITETVSMGQTSEALAAWSDDPASVTKIHVQIG